MAKSAASPAKKRRASLDAVLSFAWSGGVFVVSDAMEATGLTRSTAIEAIDELIHLGLLRELPNARAAGDYSKGRPSRRVELRADAAVVVGVDAGRTHLTAIVTDLRGKELARVREDLDVDQETHQGRRDAIVGAMDAALLEAGSERQRVLVACVGVPAPVDLRGRSPRQAEGFWQRMNPDLEELLSQWVPLVRVENDACLAAVAEGSVGMAVGLENFVVLLAGDRFGAGVVIDGHLLRGHHGGVGEMRFLNHVRGVDAAEGIGARLTAWARADLSAGELPPGVVRAGLTANSLDARGVLQLAREGDDWARLLVERAGELLARISAVFSSLYDPSRIVVAGAVAEDLDEVLQAARSHLPLEREYPEPTLTRSRLGGDAVVTGAISAALETARDGVLQLGPAMMARLQAPEPPAQVAGAIAGD